MLIFLTINDIKLKGGFIADVISCVIITEVDSIYLILKHENETNNDLSNMAKQLDLYNREYYFYTSVSSYITNIKYPKFFNLLKNNNNKVYGIILEDLNKKKYKINLDLNVENINVTLKIIDRMANLHTSFWNKDIKSIFPEIKCSTDTIFNPFFSYLIHLYILILLYFIFKFNYFIYFNFIIYLLLLYNSIAIVSNSPSLYIVLL